MHLPSSPRSRPGGGRVRRRHRPSDPGRGRAARLSRCPPPVVVGAAGRSARPRPGLRSTLAVHPFGVN
ncbi:hypothetical protein Ae706Ps2_0613c [Pseudonocardia sp. Ae706_Ps2]|nr:hypothetical protein Ae706Ps2_0613c [Pseudonocardia sp. Ae706_Ps2]